VITDIDGDHIVVVQHSDGETSSMCIKPNTQGFSLYVKLGRGKKLHDLMIEPGE
jgi:hypothetical protein